MEENKEEVFDKRNGLIALGGVFLIGYILGGVQANKRITESYSKGVSDTLEKLIFRFEK